MTKSICVAASAAAFLMALTFGIGDAHAQGKKAAAKKCPANYLENCIKTCNTRGGRTQLCPTYCANQQTKNC
jgi:hypothetical protein